MLSSVNKETGELSQVAGKQATADKIFYDNTESGIPASNVQEAIDKSARIFYGTRAEWNELTTEEKVVYEYAAFDEGEPFGEVLYTQADFTNNGFDTNLNDAVNPNLWSSPKFVIRADETLVIDTDTAIQVYIYNRNSQYWVANKVISAGKTEFPHTIGCMRFACENHSANITIYKIKKDLVVGSPRTTLNWGEMYPFDGNLPLASVMTFGDSIAAGYTAGAPIKVIPHYFMGTAVGHAEASGFKPISGTTYSDYTSDGRTMLLDTLKENDITNQFGITYVAAGVNDFSLGTELDVFESAVEETFDYIARNCSAQVVIQSPLNVSCAYARTTAKYKLSEYRKILEKYAFLYDFIYLDGGSFKTFPQQDVGTYSPWADGLHPSQIGYTGWSVEIMEKLGLHPSPLMSGKVNEVVGQYGITWTGEVFGDCPVYRLHYSGTKTDPQVVLGDIPITGEPIRVQGYTMQGATYCPVNFGGFISDETNANIFVASQKVYLQSTYNIYEIDVYIAATTSWNGQS